LVKEVALLGGTVKGLVSPVVERMLRERYRQRKLGKR
jgi:phosphopantetheine adenylyltransferase